MMLPIGQAKAYVTNWHVKCETRIIAFEWKLAFIFRRYNVGVNRLKKIGISFAFILDFNYVIFDIYDVIVISVL